MKFSTSVLSSLVFAAMTIAAPHSRRDTQVAAIDVLQYALSAEHLEIAFYNHINDFTAEDFTNAGFEPYVRERYLQIVANEQSHVDVLTSVITAAGAQPNAACTYKFPFNDLQGFLDVSHQFDNVGASAYAGAAAFITDNPAYLTAAAGILATEARHAAWIGATVYKQNPWNSPFEYQTPLSFRQIWTIAHVFVESCPEDMSHVPGFTTYFPSVEVDLTNYNTTGKAKFTYTPANGTVTDGQQLFAAFCQGSGTLYAPIDPNTNEAVVPTGLQGFVFPLVTSVNGSTADEHVIAGPTVSQFPFAANGDALTAV